VLVIVCCPQPATTSDSVATTSEKPRRTTASRLSGVCHLTVNQM
jgi:hypothetical protein